MSFKTPLEAFILLNFRRHFEIQYKMSEVREIQFFMLDQSSLDK